MQHAGQLYAQPFLLSPTSYRCSSPNPLSPLNRVQDSETLEQITRDVVRTHPDMHFFTGDTEEAELHRQVRDSEDLFCWELAVGMSATNLIYAMYGGRWC